MARPMMLVANAGDKRVGEGAADAARPGWGCYAYTFKGTPNDMVMKICSKRCEEEFAGFKGRADPNYQSDLKPCVAVTSVWCFTVGASERCLPTREECQQKRDNATPGTSLPVGECVEAR